MKNCPYCKTQFTPHPKVGKRQITCGEPACKAALKSDNNRKWRQRNPDYHRDYPRVKGWLEQKPGYLKKYRESHPEYVEKNRAAQRVRDRRKKLRLDIQAQLDVKPLEITFILTTLPCLIYKFSWTRPFIREKMSPFPAGGDNHVPQKNSQCFTGS